MKAEKQYTPEVLIQSGRYAGRQRDFLRVILSKSLYTLKEADKAVSDFFDKE